jgi:hypothetical protein
LTITFLCCCTASAQYGNNGYGNNGYGVGGRGYGSNNGRMSQMNQTRDTENQKSVEVIVDKIMETKKELVLDQLQEIVISNVLKKALDHKEFCCGNHSRTKK